jgi:hypothetical protein
MNTRHVHDKQTGDLNLSLICDRVQAGVREFMSVKYNTYRTRSQEQGLSVVRKFEEHAVGKQREMSVGYMRIRSCIEQTFCIK